jgi:hypothetical protein
MKMWRKRRNRGELRKIRRIEKNTPTVIDIF